MAEIFSFPNLKKIYLASLLLVILPPFYLVASFLNVNTLAKILWLIIFLPLVLPKEKSVAKEGTLLWLFLAFFVSQALSVFGAINVFAFLQQYEDLIFTALFFFISFRLINNVGDIKNVVAVLLAGGVINLIFQAAIFLFPNAFLKFAELFLHEGYLEIIKINVGRSRVYFEGYDEILIPILIYLWVNLREKISSTFSLFYLLLITTFSFISNFRTRFLMLIFSLFSSLFLFLKTKKTYLLGLFMIPATIFFLYSVLSRNVGFTVFDRLLLESEREDVKTVTGRVEKWKKTVEIGLSAPLFGVGLGNYYDYLDPAMKQYVSLFEQTRKEFELAAYDPHGIFFKIFAESGFLGLFSFLLLLAYFLKKDFKILLAKDDIPKTFVISFWTLFLYALINPSYTTKYQALFWLIRVLVEKSKGLYSLQTPES
ncbi:MAG: O-antigen ligase family protein [Patescibacteria group bacterium]